MKRENFDGLNISASGCIYLSCRYYNSLMKGINKAFKSFRELAFNLKRMLRLSWQTDKFLTSGYYGTSGLSAIFPIIASYIYKLFIDNTISNLGVKPSVPIILIVILGSRYLSNWI